jgi:hypothetical protein
MGCFGAAFAAAFCLPFASPGEGSSGLAAWARFAVLVAGWAFSALPSAG